MSTIWTNGCFDMLHAGHVEFLRKCRYLADDVVVFMNSDESVRGLKGPDRPIIPQNERMSMLLDTKLANFVVMYDEPTAVRVMQEQSIRPRLYARSTDEDLRSTPEGQLLLSWGVPIVMIPTENKARTMGLIDRIVSRYAARTVSGS